MAGFQIIDMPSECLLLPIFHSVSNTNVIWINLESNRFSVLSDFFSIELNKQAFHTVLLASAHTEYFAFLCLGRIFRTLLEKFKELY